MKPVNKFDPKCPNCGKKFKSYVDVYKHMKYWCKKTDNNLRGADD